MESPTPPDPDPSIRPPPVPPPPGAVVPGPPPRSRRTRKALIITGTLVAVLVLAVLAASPLLLAFVSDSKAEARAKAVEDQALRRNVPPTPPGELGARDRARVEEFGRELAKRLSEGDANWLQEAIDFDAMAARAFEGLPANRESRAEFIAGLRNNVGGGSLLEGFLGARNRFMRLGERDGFPSLVLRIDKPGGGLGFIELVVNPASTGCRVIDVYNHVSSALLTRESGMLTMLVQGTRSEALSRRLGLPKLEPTALEEVARLAKCQERQDHRGLVAAYDRMQPHLRTNRACMALLLTALQQLSADKDMEARYIKTLETAPVLDPTSAGVPLRSLFLHARRGEFAKAAEAAGAAGRILGPDAQLLRLEGVLWARAGQSDRASRCLKEAESIEPELPELLDLRLVIQAAKGDHAGAVEVLRQHERANGLKLDPDTIIGDEYQALRGSPEFRRWAAEPRE